MGLAHFGEVKRSRWVGLMCGLERRSFLSVTGGRSFSLQQDRRSAHWAVTAALEGKGGSVCVFFVLFFFFRGRIKLVEILPACLILSCRRVCLAAGGFFVE